MNDNVDPTSPDRLAALVCRFQFSAHDLSDKRIDRLLRQKAKLDAEVSRLVVSGGAREARVARTGKLLGFSAPELNHCRAIGNLIRSIIEASECIRTWTPKESKPQPTKVETTECPTKQR